jgi:hypothetical protein
MNKTEPTLDFPDVLNWVEEAFLDDEKKKVLTEIGEAYSNSQITVKFIEEKQKYVAELKKKIQKLTGTSSNLTATENSDAVLSSSAL